MLLPTFYIFYILKYDCNCDCNLATWSKIIYIQYVRSTIVYDSSEVFCYIMYHICLKVLFFIIRVSGLEIYTLFNMKYLANIEIPTQF